MSKHTQTHFTPIHVRILCLLMSGLTACSSLPARGSNAAATTSTSVDAKNVVMESWGEAPGDASAPNPVIHPGFLLSLRSFSDAKINGDFRVEFDGRVELPYDVTLNAAGLDLFELKRKLSTVYRSYFKTAPDVDVRVKERRSWIDVRGLVEKPGRYLVEQNASLDSVIGMAGGPSRSLPPEYVRIRKGEQTCGIDLNQYFRRGEDMPKILGWIGGEILFFQREDTVSRIQRTASGSLQPIYMTGEVRKPGEYTLHPGGDFLETLLQAGGFTERADLSKIEIIRRTPTGKQAHRFNWNDLQSIPSPLPGDVVYVHSDSVTRAERRTTLIATVIGTAATILTSAILVLSYNRGKI